MKYSLAINHLLILLITMSSASIFGQKLEPKERITEPDHTINSEIMGKDYQLYISFPKNYSTKDTISYPVLIVLDGEYSFPIIQGSMGFFSLRNEIEDVIIVGISSGLTNESQRINRAYDYTISIDTTKQMKTGGAPKFLDCIKNEIIPFVDKNYKTNTDRGITGHSFGGLFTAYCFINSSGYFTRFGINSPSFGWGNEELLNQAVLQFTENKTLDTPPTKVYVSVGSLEGPGMVSRMVKFSSYLENCEYENLDIYWQIHDDESHISVWPINISKTISNLYRKTESKISLKK
jgi:predicted alpha/beta superfamily hydrolase